jgi:hypothetical protein
MDENNLSSINNNMDLPFFESEGKTDEEVFAEARYRSGVKTLQKILQKDKSKDKPKKLFDSNFKPTKKALKYNRKLIREGKLTNYIEKGSLYLPKQGALGTVIKKAFDKEGKLKPSLAVKYKVRQGTGVTTDGTETKTFTAPSPIDSEFTEWKGDGLANNDLLKELAQGLKGKYRIIIKVDGKIIADEPLTIGDDLLTDWQVYENKFRIKSSSPPAMLWNSDKDGNPLPQGTKVTISFIPMKQLTLKTFKQLYKEGLTNCLLSPIKDYFLDISASRKTKVAQQKAFSRLNKVFDYMCEYRDGVPESKIKDLCDELQIGIKLEQPFSNEIYYSYTSMKKPSKIFKMINTRINHVDYCFDDTLLPRLDRIYNDATPEYVTRDELNEIHNSLKGESMVTQKDGSGAVTSLRTLDKFYSIKNDFTEKIIEFETSTGLRYVGFDALQYPSLMHFVNHGTHFNGTVDFTDTYKWRKIGKNDAPPRGVRLIDQKKAYSNFYKSKFYCGFMGKITDFRKINHHRYNGLYFITNIDFSKCDKKFIKLNDQLMWFLDNNVYSKAELDALEHYGATFTVTHGAYGMDIDFRFNEDMLNGIELTPNRGEVKYYAKYCGMLASLNPYKNFYMKGNRLLLQTISQSKNLKIYDYGYDEHCIAFRKKHLYSKKHITAQVTAYQRLCMLEQLMNMNVDKLIRICVDGVYYYDHQFDIIDGFNEKYDYTFKNEDCKNYLSNIIVNTEEFDFIVKEKLTTDIAEPREFYEREFFAGAGGTGKTYYNLYVDTGLIHPIYVAPSWKLATDMAKEYKQKTKNNLRVTVLQRLLDTGAYPEMGFKFNNYIIDEASMILEGQKQNLFTNVKGKIIMIGDLDFQLKPVYIQEKEHKKLCDKYGKEHADSYKQQMTLDNFDNIRLFENIYRFKDCVELQQLAQYIRNNIKNVIDMNKLPYIKYITIKQLKKLYKKEDMILRFHNEKKNKYLKNNYTEIFDDIEKYKVTSNYTEYKNGEIVFEKPNNVTLIEKRHGYTTHSVQGLTFDNNIFIDLTGMKYQNRMLYTAISRARKISQLYIIKDV